MQELTIKNRTIGTGRPLVCVPVMENEASEIIKQISYLGKSRADVIEWRVDGFGAFDDCNAVREVLDAIKPLLGDKLLLYTFRSKLQGGQAEADAELLRDLQDLAVESGCVDIVDVEFFAEKSPLLTVKRIRDAGVHVITSHHDFAETPEPGVMRMLLDRMCAGGADIVKLAVMPKCYKDVLDLLQVTAEFHEENPDTPIVTMSMGKIGGVSRLCGETFGSCMTFGAYEKPSAPGQYGMEDLIDILDTIHRSNEREEQQS